MRPEPDVDVARGRRDHLSECAHLSPSKVPSRWLRVDALPVNSGGKVVKARLREMFEAGQARPGGITR